MIVGHESNTLPRTGFGSALRCVVHNVKSDVFSRLSFNVFVFHIPHFFSPAIPRLIFANNHGSPTDLVTTIQIVEEGEWPDWGIGYRYPIMREIRIILPQ